jgi:hypothetical protein
LSLNRIRVVQYDGLTLEIERCPTEKLVLGFNGLTSSSFGCLFLLVILVGLEDLESQPEAARYEHANDCPPPTSRQAVSLVPEISKDAETASPRSHEEQGYLEDTSDYVGHAANTSLRKPPNQVRFLRLVNDQTIG